MMLDDIVARISDPYERQSRLYPALLSLLPVLALLAVSNAPNTSALTRVATISVSCGGLLLLTNICREMGKRLEQKLFREWGGKPTTQLLRHSNTVLDSVTKHRYHQFLAGSIGTTFPDAQQEKSDPAKADETYQSGARWLLDRTRPHDGKEFSLLFRDNVAYGFRRNALAIKPFGLILSVGSALWVLIREGVLFGSGHRFIDVTRFFRMSEPGIASLIVSAAMISVWLSFVTKTATRSAAFGYAEKLLRTCDSL